MPDARGTFASRKRIVVKIGSSSLTYDTGSININSIERFSRVISDLTNRGLQIILVTSGSVAFGRDMLKIKRSDNEHGLAEKQALAAVGQSRLMSMYSKFFMEYGHIAGQILLTKDVTENGLSRVNALNTFNTLLENKVIPIVNENDTVSTEGVGRLISYGDNDTLSAIVAVLTEAELLINLSDQDGFYDKDPKENDDARLIKTVREITPEIENMASGAGSEMGTGGMKTKIMAAEIATGSGVDMVIANGGDPGVLYGILDGEDIGTLFLAKRADA